MRHILIVDDDEDDRDIFCEAVHEVEPSIKCILARNGQEALNGLRFHYPRPDMMVIDLNMPRIDGWQCLREIKNDRSLQNIPVVIYTTSKQEEYIAEANALGADHYLVKPYGFRELCESVRQILHANDIAKINLMI